MVATCILARRDVFKGNNYFAFFTILKERPFNSHSQNKGQSFKWNTCSLMKNSPHACSFLFCQTPVKEQSWTSHWEPLVVLCGTRGPPPLFALFSTAVVTLSECNQEERRANFRLLVVPGHVFFSHVGHMNPVRVGIFLKC